MTSIGLTPETLIVFAVSGALFVVLLALASGVVIVLGEPRRRMRRRIDGLGLRAGGGDGGLVGAGERTVRRGGGSGGGEAQSRQKRIQEKLRELDKTKQGRARRRNRLRQSLTQAGLSVDARVFLVVTLLMGVGAGLAVLVLGLGPLVGLLVGVTVAFGLPKLFLGILAGRRRKRFMQEFPNAIDVLVRGVQSGLPIGECVGIVGREIPDPVGAEFRMMVEGQRLGLTLNEIMTRGLERMPTPEYKFFAIVLQIQQQTGGNLAETLSNLSAVLRDRKQMRNKVKALSSEAKASAWIIGSLPFIVFLLVTIVSPNYMKPLITHPIGHIIVAGSLTWMAIGVAIMAKMINFKM